MSWKTFTTNSHRFRWEMLSNWRLSSCINKRNVLKAHVVKNKKSNNQWSQCCRNRPRMKELTGASWVSKKEQAAGGLAFKLALSALPPSPDAHFHKVYMRVSLSPRSSHARQCGRSHVKKGGGTALCWGVVFLTYPVPWPLPLLWSLLLCLVVSLFLSQLRPWSLLEGSTALQSSLMTAPLKGTERF